NSNPVRNQRSMCDLPSFTLVIGEAFSAMAAPFLTSKYFAGETPGKHRGGHLRKFTKQDTLRNAHYKPIIDRQGNARKLKKLEAMTFVIRRSMPRSDPRCLPRAL